MLSGPRLGSPSLLPPKQRLVSRHVSRCGRTTYSTWRDGSGDEGGSGVGRGAAAAAAAPASGTCGQDLDIALLIADGGPKGRADPAYDAHLLPIGEWAEGAWHERLPRTAREGMVRSALSRIAAAKSPWQHVHGPGAAMVASAQRLGWTVHDENSVRTDMGRTLLFDTDSPAVIKEEVSRAVRRWRDMRIFRKHPHLGDTASSHGLQFSPIWNVLNGRRHPPDWGPPQRAALISSISGRQWPQARCWRAGFTTHDHCMLCSSTDDTVDHDGDTPPTPSGMGHRGTLQHRMCDCPILQDLRQQHAPSTLLQLATTEGSWQIREAFATCLFPLKILELPPTQLPPPQGTFEWVQRQDALGGHIQGKVYTDGSRIHDVHPDTMRLGWAFVVLDQHDHIVAIARGVPPDYVRDIPGAEAWALLQASSLALAGSTFKSDCKPCVDAIHAGELWACDARRPLARIFRQLFAHIGDVPASSFVWMPSHTSLAKVGVTRLSDGQVLTHADRRANMCADDHARIAAATFATPDELRCNLQRHNDTVKDVKLVA